MRWQLLLLLLAFALSPTQLAVANEPPRKRKIVLVAGPKSHGPLGNRIHDYPWSVKLLKVMLDNSNVRDRIRVEYHLNGWPENPATFDDADTILVVSDGRDGDKFQEAPHFRDEQQTARIQEQIDRGCGFATFHFSTFAPDKREKQSFQWTGGYFDWETNGQRKWYSAIKTLEESVQLVTKTHPILRGVEPFKMREEFYYNIRFATAGVTPLWTVPALDGRSPDGKTVAWAKVRPDGGRGFGTTCGHFYDNWRHESFRKTILNALVWTAGLEPPADGVAAPFYSHEQINLALQTLGPDLGLGDDRPATVDAEPIRVLMFAGNEAHAWHNWKKTTPAITKLLTRDPRMRVEVTNQIEDLARKDLGKVDVIVQNYVNWNDPTQLSEKSKAAFTRFLHRGGGLVLVHFANGAFHFSLPDAGASDWPEYRRISRRVWDHQGKGESKSGHDAFGVFQVRRTKTTSPITRGLADSFSVEDELYFRQSGAEPISPLITAHSKVTNRDEPLAWTYNYGKGRVFQTLLGHSEKTYNAYEAREMLRRAVAWTAGREPLSIEPQRDPSPNAAPVGEQGAAPPANDKRSRRPQSRIVPGKFGNALNAARGAVAIKSGEGFRKPPLTVDLWTKLRSRRAYNILVASESKASPRHWEIFTEVGSGRLSVYLPGCKPDHVRTELDLCNNQWRNVRMVFEPQRVRLWVDGKLTADAKVQVGGQASLSEPLVFGGLVSGKLGCDGLLDNILIRAGAHPPPSTEEDAPPDDTLGLWRFDRVTPDGGFPAVGEPGGEALPPDGGDSKGAAGDGRKRPAKQVARPAAPDHWGRTVVGFDWAEKDSVDGRWSKTDVGRFLACTMMLDGHPVRKGLAIRTGDNADFTALYDTKTMQLRAAWAGGFLRFDPARYGLIRHPSVDGQLVFSSPSLPAWENYEFAFHGAYRHGARQILVGKVQGARVLDSAWSGAKSGHRWLERTLAVAPHNRPLQMNLLRAKDLRQVGDNVIHGLDLTGRPLALALVQGSSASERRDSERRDQDSHDKQVARLRINDQGRVIVDIDAHDASISFSILYQAGGASPDLIASSQAARVPDLSALLTAGPALWTTPIVTKGIRAQDDAGYVIDTITLPFDNPYRALMFVGGHDFFSNGDAALCTVHGDVWVASGIDADLDRITWKRFATGLYQPLGLRILNDRVYVLGRDQITRLHDHNDDGEADFYENFNNDVSTSTGTHDYVTCLESDQDGNLYFLHAKQGMLKVASDGSRLDVIATGFRNPNGMGLGAKGQLTASPQEGEWTPGSNIALVRQGGYYGFGGPRISPDRPLGYDPPLCWIPRRLDNSSGGQVWTQTTNWGPLSDRMLHLSFGQSSALLVLTEEVDSAPQGGVLALPWRFDSGVMRGRVHPQDGQLYVSGMTGWVSNAAEDGCLQRIRYTGKPLLIPTAVRSWSNGVALRFSQPLDEAFVEDADRYHVERWLYRYSGSYGSDEYRASDDRLKGRDEVAVRSATLLDDRTVFLELSEMLPVMQLGVRFDVRAKGGMRAKNTFYHTLHRIPDAGVSTNRLSRKTRPGALTPAQREALRAGLQAKVRPSRAEASPTRHLRLRMAAFVPESKTAGGRMVQASGLLKSPIRAQYEFTASGKGELQVRINDKLVLNAAGELNNTRNTVELHKGYNRIQLTYIRHGDDAEHFRLLWRSEEFSWEPIPPALLFHLPDDGVSEATNTSGRAVELVSQLRCARCHEDLGEELEERDWLGPDLRQMERRLTRDWVAAWIAEPGLHRRDARMPNLLSNDPATRRAEAANLAAFLIPSLRADTSPVAAEQQDVSQGLRLYESLACIACHRFTPPAEDDEFARTSLHFAAAKFQRGAIANFLLAPNAHYSATRMPKFELTKAEAAALEAYLRARSLGSVETTPAANAAAGRKAFIAKNCHACHQSDHSVPQPASVVKSPGRPSTPSCVDPPSKDQAWSGPRYALEASDRTVIASYLVRDGKTGPKESTAERAERWMRRLQCAACHDRDQRRARRGVIILDEGELGTAPEVYPGLTWAGEKLHQPWMERFLAGEFKGGVRPWLRGRMPAFPTYAKGIAAGLSQQHGIDEEGPPIAQLDSETIAQGKRLIQKTVGLDCRQCHAVGSLQPTGDARTKIAPGINFELTATRLRPDYYHRFVLDPTRYELGTKMPRFSLDRKTTALKDVYGGDAKRQFEAIWQYLRSLPSQSSPAGR